MSADGATAFPIQSIVTCGVCGEATDIPWFCKNCVKSLCSSCQICHQTDPLYKEHLVVQRSMEVLRLYGPSKIAEPCHIHSSKEISAYCNKCFIPCCISCLVEEHQNHHISTIEEKYLSAEKYLGRYAKELQNNIKPKVDEAQDAVREHLSRKEKVNKEVKQEINSFRRKLKQAVDNSCDKLLEDLERSHIDLNDLITSLEVQKKEIDMIIKETEIKVREGKLGLIRYTPPSLSSLRPEISLLLHEIPCFIPGNSLLEQIELKLGTIRFNEIKISKVKSFNCKIRATSVVVAGNNSAWVMDDNNDTMHLIKISGNIIRSVTVSDSRGINDMVIMKSGEMLVTCWDQKVRRVSGRGVVSVLTDTAPFEPKGVCLNDKEEFVVCMRDQGERSHVAVYSPDGSKKLREIRGVDYQGTQRITSPYRVVLNDKDLCVVNSGGNVVCMDEKDSVRWMYDGKQAELKQSFDPCSVCVDKYQNLLVTDSYNHCVHYIGREGGLLQIILTEEQTGLSNYRGISVDDGTGHVWLGNVWKIVIAKYLK